MTELIDLTLTLGSERVVPVPGRHAEGVLFRQHQSYEEREEVAQTCSLDLHISIPILVEEMDNYIDEAYGAAPERLYLIGADGSVAYQGGAGPHFFDLEEWEQAIEACLPVEAPNR